MYHGYTEITTTNQTIIDTVDKALGNIKEKNCSENVKSTKEFIFQLEQSASKAINANSVSILFEVFSFALLSAGCYLALHAQAQTKRAEGRVKKVSQIARKLGPITKNGYNSSQLIVRSSLARSMSQQLKGISNLLGENERGIIDSLIPQLRDIFTFINKVIEESINEKIGLDMTVRSQLYDDIIYIKNIFEGLSLDIPADIVDKVNKIINKMNTPPDLVELYEKYTKELDDD